MKSTARVLLGLIVTLPLAGGIPNASCGEPFVFHDARVNVIVLPYVNSEVSSPDLERVSSQLSLLLQQTILFSALKHPSIGTARMLAPNPARAVRLQAGDDRAEDFRAGPGALQELNQDGAAILLWGQIYKEADQVYLCTYAKLVKRGEDIAMERSGGGQGVFLAKLPSDAVTFPVRVITTLCSNRSRRRSVNPPIAHQDRSLTSPGLPASHDPQNPFRSRWSRRPRWLDARPRHGRRTFGMDLRQ